MIKQIFKRTASLLLCLLLLFVLTIGANAEGFPGIDFLEEAASEQDYAKWIDNSFEVNSGNSLAGHGSAEIITDNLMAEDVFASGSKKGDIDKDGEITSSDAVRCLKASVGLETLKAEESYLADADEDGYITSTDALQILRASVGLIEKYTVVDGSEYRITDPYTAYDYEKLQTEIKALAVRYYGAVKLSSIGETSSSSKLYLLRLGKGSKKVLYVGTMHGSEHINTALLMRMAERYAYCFINQKKFNGRDVYSLLNEYTIYIVPMSNPDGADKTIHEDLVWKANGRGVDLNRNFPTSTWAELDTGVYEPARKLYKGKSAGSEKETKALIKLCDENSFKFAISFHSKGQVIYWKDTLSNTVPGAEELTQKTASSTGYSIMSTTTSVNDYSGGFENWFREAYNKPGLCVETTPSNGTTKPHNNADFDSIIWSKASNVGLDVLS